MNITDINSDSGKEYALGYLKNLERQYMNRDYQFNHIPKELENCIHIKTHGNDKFVSENRTCFSFSVDCPVEVLVLYADKFPLLPRWLEEYERSRWNITRQDTNANSLKGYFSIYKKNFAKGKIMLGGCSPEKMLNQNWYIPSMGTNYCMYTAAVRRLK